MMKEKLGGWIRMFAIQGRIHRPFTKFLNIILGCDEIYVKQYGDPGTEKRRMMWETILEEVGNLSALERVRFGQWLQGHAQSQEDLQITIMKKLETPENSWILKMLLHKAKHCRDLMKQFIYVLIEKYISQKEVWTKLLSFLLDHIQSSDNSRIPAQVFTVINKIAERLQMRKAIVRLLPKLQEIFCSDVEREQAGSQSLEELNVISRLLTNILESESIETFEGVDVARMIKAIVNYRPMLEYSIPDTLDSFFKLLKPLVKRLATARFDEITLHDSPFFELLLKSHHELKKLLRPSTQEVVKKIVEIIFERFHGTEQSTLFRKRLWKLINDNDFVSSSGEHDRRRFFWPFFLLWNCSKNSEVLSFMHRESTLENILKNMPKVSVGESLRYMLEIERRYFEWCLEDNERIGVLLERMGRISSSASNNRQAFAHYVIVQFTMIANKVSWSDYKRRGDDSILDGFFPIFEACEKIGVNLFSMLLHFIKRGLEESANDKEESQSKEKHFFFNYPYKVIGLLKLSQNHEFQTNNDEYEQMLICLLWMLVFKDQAMLEEVLPEDVWTIFKQYYEKIVSTDISLTADAVHNIWNYRFLGYRSNTSNFPHINLMELPEEILAVFDRALHEMTGEHEAYFTKVIDWILSSPSPPPNTLDNFISLSTLCARNEDKILTFLNNNDRVYNRLADLLKTVEEKLEEGPVSDSIKRRFEEVKQQCSTVCGELFKDNVLESCHND